MGEKPPQSYVEALETRAAQHSLAEFDDDSPELAIGRSPRECGEIPTGADIILQTDGSHVECQNKAWHAFELLELRRSLCLIRGEADDVDYVKFCAPRLVTE
jgi:hypothetical protein